MKRRILLTGFSNTSAELLIAGQSEYDILLLPSDVEKDRKLLLQQMSSGNYDLVISIGQRPNIKDKLHVETTARVDDCEMKTTVDCEGIVSLFKTLGLDAKVSNNAGNSYCNALYYSGLFYITEDRQSYKMLFIHIPFLKNITDFSVFQKKFFHALGLLKMKGVEDFG